MSEIGDTLVITTDAAERSVWQINTLRQTRKSLARRGDGPGEYQSAGRSVHLGRDSVALLNLQHTRFPVISAQTGRGRTHRLTGTAEASGSLAISAPILRYADTLGHVYGAPRFAGLKTVQGSNRRDLSTLRELDTIPILRFALDTNRVDAIFSLARGVTVASPSRDPDGKRVRVMELGAYGPYNDWLVTAGGLLVVADAAQSSVLIRDLSQRPASTRTFVIPHTPLSVDKARWRTHVQGATSGTSAEIGRIASRTFSRAGLPVPTPVQPRYVVPDMPRELPAFNFGDGKRHMHEADGLLWMPVHIDDAAETEYWDLVRLVDGERIGTLKLPPRQYLVAVTSRGAYVLAVDADDVQRLLFHRKAAQLRGHSQ